VTMATIQKYLTCDLTEIPKDDIEILLKSLNEELKSRRTVNGMIMELKRSYRGIDWGGGNWKSEKTADAVRELAGLGGLEWDIHDAILAMCDDIEEQWSAALSFTLLVTGMIKEAEGHASKLVNGSYGEWCPDTAWAMAELWKQLASNEGRPSEETIVRVCTKLHRILGDYECSLQDTLNKIQKGSVNENKRQKIEVVYPTE